MGNFYLSHSAAELDEAVGKVLSGEAFNKKYTEGYNDGYEKGLEEATPTLQSKEVIPSLVEQIIKADTGFDGLLSVFVQAVPKSILDAEYQKGYNEAFELYKPYKRELGYIQSNGTQYIDTGFKPKYNSRVIMTISDVSTGSTLFGARDTSASASPNTFGAYVNSSSALRSDYFGTTNTATPNSLSVKTELDKNGNVLTAYGLTITNTAVSSGAVSYPLHLFAVNSVGTATGLATMKLYSCQIYDNGTLVRDYIPVLDWDNIPCIYDKVTRKLYYNAGTGTFGYPVDLPEGYTQVSYIQSSGTQYVDTGFKPNQDTRVLIETYCPLNSGSLLGAIGTGGTKRYGVYVGNNYRNDYNTSTLNGLTTNVTTRFVLDKNKNVQTVNGVSSTVAYAQFSVDKPLYLFAFNDSGTANYFGAGIKIYSCQIYDNGTLARDFIPCKNASGAVGLYDLVNNKFYTNAGSGTFTYA